MTQKTTKTTQPPFGVRMPESLKSVLAERARENGRSLNSEIIQILKSSLSKRERDLIPAE